MEKDILRQGKQGDCDLGIEHRMDVPSKAEGYVTLKDHKLNYIESLPCRLLNPNKPESGKISKMLLEKINNGVRPKIGVNQWRNTAEVIEWFKLIQRKDKAKFIVFDIESFYPNISAELLKNSLDWALQYVDISNDERKIIMTAKNTLLYSKNIPWCKKNSADSFDVTMGSFDGAETCELVGLYLLFQLKKLELNLGLYRDDGLGISYLSNRQTDILKKKICQIFRENGLNISVECNKQVVNFLDVTLDLQVNLFKPYMKPNKIIQYVHFDSNHPPHVLKNIPLGVNKRLSMLSSNEQVFNEAIPKYQEALN